MATLLALACSGVAPAVARADEAPRARRFRVVGGFSLGVGTISALDRYGSGNRTLWGGGTAAAHVGLRLQPDVVLLLDATVLVHPVGGMVEGPRVWEYSLVTGAAQFWLASRVWLELGLGVGFSSGTGAQNLGDGDLGPGGLLGLGIELVQRPRWSLDLQLRLGSVRYDENAVNMSGLMVGARWH